MAASAPDDALRGLRERDIDFVAFCTTESWIPMVAADAPGTLYHSLVMDRPPPWLRRIPLMDVGGGVSVVPSPEGPVGPNEGPAGTSQEDWMEASEGFRSTGRLSA